MVIGKKGLTSNEMHKMYIGKVTKGVPKNVAFKIVGQKKKESMWQGMGTVNRAKMRRKHMDSDKDGVPDKWDCKPYNKYKQDEMHNITVEEVLEGMKYSGGLDDNKLKKFGLNKEQIIKAAKKLGNPDILYGQGAWNPIDYPESIEKIKQLSK